MTDNRTTELLRKLLEERGLSCQTNYLHASWRVGLKLYEAMDNLDGTLTVGNLTPEQAIAATLGSESVDYMLNTIGMLEEENERLRSSCGTLTAEQVEKIVNRNCEWYEGGELDAQAIADELNAELGGRNCARCAEDMGRYADSLCDPLKERIAELLRRLENDWHIHASWDGLRKFWCIELTEEGVRLRDAELGSGTCEVQHVKSGAMYDVWRYTCCGYEHAESVSEEAIPQNFCPNCGKRVSA